MANVPNELVNAAHDAPSLDGTAIERTICGLSGVCGARVVLHGAEIKEVHVLASPRRAPKKVIRDIESVVLVQYGYRIDYRRISLAQVADVAAPVAERITLQQVDQVRTAQGEEHVVTLSDGQHTYRGTQRILGNDVDAAGKATVAALNTLFAPAAPLALRGIDTTTIGNRQVVIAYVVHNNNEHVLGTAFVQRSLSAAAAHAVLDATNQHLADWLPANTTMVFARAIGA